MQFCSSLDRRKRRAKFQENLFFPFPADLMLSDNDSFVVKSDGSYHLLKYVWYLPVLYVNFSVKSLKSDTFDNFPIFSLFWWPFLLP